MCQLRRIKVQIYSLNLAVLRSCACTPNDYPATKWTSDYVSERRAVLYDCTSRQGSATTYRYYPQNESIWLSGGEAIRRAVEKAAKTRTDLRGYIDRVCL